MLALPPETQAHDDWKAFRLALQQHQLSLVEIVEENNDYMKVEINTSSKEEEELVMDFLQLCFSKCYKV
jgi:hypothetical protein